MSPSRLVTLLWSTVFVVSSVPVAFASDDDGTSAFHFLNLSSSARTEALGGAAVSLGEASDALAWNPALLLRASSREFSAAYGNWLFETNSGFASYVHPWSDDLALGVAFRSLSVTEFNNVVGGTPIDQSDFAGTVGLGYKLRSDLGAGASARFVRSSLAEEDASGLAFDVGLDYEYVKGWHVGAALRNWGPALSYVDGIDEQLPTRATLGVGGTVGELRFGTEVLWENGPGALGAFGAEYWWRNRVAVRAGSRFGTGGNQGVEPWSAGLGVRARDDVEVDYSFRDGKLDVSHRLGVRWTPGRSLVEEEDGIAVSPREFYVAVLDQVLEQSLVDFPRDLGDTVLVRAKASGGSPHPGARVIGNEVVSHLQNWGLQAKLGEPSATVHPDTLAALAPEVRAQVEESLKPKSPTLEFTVSTSEYRAKASGRERYIGPRSVVRSAEIELAFELLMPGRNDPTWTGQGRAEDSEDVGNARILSSSGYPKAASLEEEGLHPLVEPAIVGGIVTGLAIIFFANRDVGE